MQRTKRTYQDTRATANLDKLNDDLKDVTKVMTKNIEDLLYRGDSLERMGDMSSRLRDESKKYRQAAVRINWEAMLKQVSLEYSLQILKEFGARNKLISVLNLVWPHWRCWLGHAFLYLVEILLRS